ncbi:MAG: glycosyltransferase involved in cell wall biosynthesis [Chlamydiales bacterium]|jgi:glycosyltransferase involved in cell wall biosynthesis
MGEPIMTFREEESEFLEYCRFSYVTRALSQLFPSPNIRLRDGAVFNYADALVHGTCLDAHITNKHLAKLLQENGEDSEFLNNDGIIAGLIASTDEVFQAYISNQEDSLPLWFSCLLSERLQRRLSQEEIHEALMGVPHSLYQSLLARILYIQRRLDFQLRETELYYSLMKGPLLPPEKALYPLTYVSSNAEGERVIRELSKRGGKQPLIFMEAFEMGWGEILEPLCGQEAIFVFVNSTSLWNCLLDDGLYKSLLEKQHLILVLDCYPNKQLLVQKMSEAHDRELYPVFVNEYELLKDKEKDLIKGISECIKDVIKERKMESAAGDHLYGIGKGLNRLIAADRLGESRSIAHHVKLSIEKWYDFHKNPLRPLWEKESFREILEKIPCRKDKRRFVKRGKVRIAHIVPQIIDSNNAPQRLMRILFRGHCQDKYEVHLFSNEYMVERTSEYPVLPLQSRSSLERGSDNLTIYESHGIKTYVDSAKGSYYEAAERVAIKLREEEIDVAIFHESDAINLLTARLSNVPVHIFYQLSSHLNYEGFDLVISPKSPPPEQVDYYHSIGTKLEVIVPSAEYVEKWNREPEKKSFFGVSEDATILTTISNHLENRLTVGMCHCISEILKDSSKSYYMPMGEVRNPDELRARFLPEIVDRVVFLGAQADPKHLSRSMALYLNEFPMGSGFGMLDAMAGGCPVVSMAQGGSSVGGAYFGDDRLVHSGKQEDYIDLANSLLKDSGMHSEWSSYTRRQYEKIADEKAYVGEFEKTIESFL